MKKIICRIATINFFIALLFIKIGSFAQCLLFVDFENWWDGNTYTPRTVNDEWGEWQVSGAVTAIDNSDHHHSGVKSIRLRGNSGDNCHFQMNFDTPFGIEEVSFYYASYGSHNGGIIVVYYSINGGATWINAGSVTSPTWSGEMLHASFPIHVQGNVRIKVVREGSLSNNTSVNIDDLCLTGYVGYTAAPNFNPYSGCCTTPISVVITSATEGATIHYTTDGTTPSTSSDIYYTPILVESTTTLKALAVKDGLDPSIVTTATYTFVYEQFTWNFDAVTGTLTISGEGEMPNYDFWNGCLPPWFDYHESIKTIIVENSVTSIGDWAFVASYNLTSIMLPNSITSIGDYAFSGFYSLTSITLPTNLTYIGNDVFFGITMGWGPYLSSIITNAVIPPMANGAFKSISKNISIYIPCGSYNSYINASGWGDYFTNIIMPEGEAKKPQICMISVGENNHNEIIWEKQDGAVSYCIYREGTQNGQYDSLATVDENAPNIWVDTESDAKIRSYRYKISAFGNCGSNSIFSDDHKTMHLTINAGQNNSWNLIWTAYEGVAYSTYNIYRASGDTPSEFALIGTMPSGNTSFSDFGAPEGYVYYVVEIMLNETCEVGKSISSIKSNIATNNPNVSVKENMLVSEITIFPNPTSGELKIESNGLRIENVVIYDAFGKIQKIENRKVKNIIDISLLSAGLYFVRISTEIGEAVRKVVKE